MGVKQLHAIAQRHQAYEEHGNILELIDQNQVETVVVDFCTTFFDLLVDNGLRTLPEHLEAGGGYDVLHPDMALFVTQALDRMQQLQDHVERVVFVLDGDSHPMKKETHSHRDRQSRQAFNKAEAEYKRLGGNVEDSQVFRTNAKKWPRFTAATKAAIVEELLQQGIQQVDFELEDNDDQRRMPRFPHGISFFVAPFEADGVVVALADLLGERAAILSVDGDLLVYGGCVDNLRLMNVQWETGVVSRYCFKRRLLDSLGLHLDNDDTYNMAQKLLLVLGTVSGNDYATNIPSFSFGKMRIRLLNELEHNRQQYWNLPLYHIYQHFLSTFNNTPRFITDQMLKALLMFGCPLVDGTNNRAWIPLEIGMDEEMLTDLLENMEHPRRLRGPVETQQSRFTLAFNVHDVNREHTAPEFTGDLRPRRRRAVIRAARANRRRRAGQRGGGTGGIGLGRHGLAATITIPCPKLNLLQLLLLLL